MTSYRQCDSYGNDILQRYHPNRQSYKKKKKCVTCVGTSKYGYNYFQYK